MKPVNPYEQYMYSYPHKTAYRPLKGISLTDYTGRLSGGTCSLYIHIPFCESKCGYCNLFSVAGQDRSMMEAYVQAVKKHAGQLAEILPEDIVFSDLTLGGGTPLILPEELLEDVFVTAEDMIGFAGGETVVETSPGQTTEEKLRILKRHGVTRVSIGVQSFHEEELKRLARNHRREQVFGALDMLKKANFPVLNIDLIYGIPGQTWETLRDSTDQALAYEPEELFVYPLYVKPGTALAARGIRRGENAFGLYERLRAYLRERGYHPYSMRRFVRCESKEGSVPGKIPVPKTCGFENTVSIGCGGRSYIGNLHFCTPFSLGHKNCLKRLESYIGREDFLEVENGFLLGDEEEKRRYVIKNILFESGISEREYGRHFGSTVLADFPVIADWLEEGFAIRTGRAKEGESGQESRICLTEKGFAWSDALGPQLISPQVRAGMEEWNE